MENDHSLGMIESLAVMGSLIVPGKNYRFEKSSQVATGDYDLGNLAIAGVADVVGLARIAAIISGTAKIIYDSFTPPVTSMLANAYQGVQPFLEYIV
jgi:hypothetical protein